MDFLSSLRRLFGALAACALLALMSFPAPATASEATRKIKLAVFDLELDDFSAGGPLAGESAVETARLQRMTKLARELLSRSGLFEIVDVKASANPMVAEHWLRKCNGCDADAARDLAPKCPSSAFSER